jgi:hypothetical protein
MLIIPLFLSAYTHLYNPVGFPAFHPDEGVYLRRSMNVLAGLGPQDPNSRFDHSQDSISSYDHPYFGQLFLAGIFKLVGNPLSHQTFNGISSIESLFTIPRLVVGALAVLDTLLVFLICIRRYNVTTAFASSILFAVMPLTWYTRRIVLDSIFLPFVLLSILFSIEAGRTNKNKLILCLLSGISLGLAIFTKIPAFTMIPVVLLIIINKKGGYFSHRKNLKLVAIWLIPVVLIPLIWPLSALISGQFPEWISGVFWQGTQRHREGKSLIDILNVFWISDPVLLLLGTAGVAFCCFRRDFVPVIWIGPYLSLLFLIGWVTHFHLILILPAFCIAAGKMIDELPRRINSRFGNIISISGITALSVFGLIFTSMLISTTVSSAQLEGIAFVANQTTSHKIGGIQGSDEITIISSPIYSWIFKYIFENKNVFSHIRDTRPITTSKILLVVDSTYKHVISKSEGENETQVQRLANIFDETSVRALFKDTSQDYDKSSYPYTGIQSAAIGSRTEQIRTNY